MTDRAALSDRLYAERIAVEFRDPSAFLAARTTVGSAGATLWLKHRAETQRRDLSATAVDVDWALKAFPLESGGDKSSTLSVIGAAASRTVEFEGGEAVLRVDPASPGREILRWRFLTLLMPASVLVAAAAAKAGVIAPPSSVRLLHRSMAPDGPVTQQHLHHSANVTFERLWAGLRFKAVCEPGDLSQSLRDKRALCPGLHQGQCHRSAGVQRPSGQRQFLIAAKHMEGWASLLQAAFIIRGLIERHLNHSGDPLACHHPDCLPAQTVARAFLEGKGPSAPPAYPWPKERRTLAMAQREQGRIDRGPKRDARSANDATDIWVKAELRILTATMARCLDKTGKETNLEALLLQYLRVKTACFSLLVQPPGEHGLEKFLHHFSQIKVYLPENGPMVARKQEEPSLNVYSTEFRVSPDAWLEALGPPTRIFKERVNDAWLIHFQRSTSGKTLPLYGSAVAKMEGYAQKVGNALAQDRRRLKDLRGIDLCGVEHHQPLWVSAQTLFALRLRSSTIAGRGCNLTPLRFTVHAGEDYHWLTSGVRSMAEPFQWGMIRRGDRLGHGLALTLDPRRVVGAPSRRSS